METKLSIWSYYYYELTAEEAVKEFKKHGINCFELSDEHGLELLSRGEPEETGRKFREFIESENFTVKQGHLWLSCKLVSEQGDLDKLCRWIELYEAIGIENAVLHCDPVSGNEALTDKERLDLNIEKLKLLEQFTKGMRIRICLENLTRIVRNADDLLYVLSKLSPERYGICLDTGHLNLCGGDQREFILKAGKHLTALHIADNEGERDQHMMPFGKGNVDFGAVVKALKEIGYSGMFNYEIPGESRAPFEVKGYKLEYIAKCFEYMMKNY